MAIWKNETDTPRAAVRQIRDLFSHAIRATKRVLDATRKLVEIHGKDEIAAACDEGDAAELQRVYGILNAGLAEIDPSLSVEDLPE